MNIKRFTAGSIQDAIKMVKKEMGPDAVILKTNKLEPAEQRPEGASRKVEVVAAIDYENSESRNAGNDNDMKAVCDRYQNLESELREIKEAIYSAEAQRTLASEFHYNKALSTHYIHFKRFGLSPNIIKECMRECHRTNNAIGGEGENLLQNSLARVLKKISIAPRTQATGDGRISAFIGPTGVGKTTTIAKIAAEKAIKDGQKGGLITLDNFRIGAVGQLKTYARIMNLSFETAANREGLQKAIGKLDDCDFILIDTAGRSPGKVGELKSFKACFSNQNKIVFYLVLSATSRYQDLIHADHQFGVLPVSSIIMTKLDETRDHADMINYLINRDKSVSYFTTGQQVPEDIEKASRKKLAGLLLRRMKQDVGVQTIEGNTYGSSCWT